MGGAIKLEESTVPTWEIRWNCKKRLCELRDELHDPAKLYLGVGAYVEHFENAPFARHGGLPGTTARLEEWFSALAKYANSGEMPIQFLAHLLQCLHATVPEGSENAWLQATGPCTVCAKNQIEVPGGDLGPKCLSVRR